MTYKYRECDPTRKYLRETFVYDERISTLRCRNTNTCPHKWHLPPPKKRTGYQVTWLNGQTHHTHRLIWIYFNGEIPKGYVIDHIDRDKLNNRVENLRAVSKSENAYNSDRSIRNQSGTTGVYFHPASKKWAAQIKINSKCIYLGIFDDRTHAVIARDAAQRVLMLILRG